MRVLDEKAIHKAASFMEFKNTPEEVAENYLTAYDRYGEFFLNCRFAGLRNKSYIDKYGNERTQSIETDTQQCAEDFNSISVTRCRKCKNKIEPYEKLYFRRFYSSGSLLRKLYCFENGYCQDCALDYAAQVPVNDYDVRVVEEHEFQFVGDKDKTTVTVLSDGSIEESNLEYGKRVLRNI